MSTIGGINFGNITDYLFLFTDGSTDANWQGATKGFMGNVAVDGIKAKERTSGTVPYAGTISTNDATLSAWQNIVNSNPGQATGAIGQSALISSLEADLVSAFHQINALPASPGYASVSSTSLNGLNTQDGIDKVYVINITSDLSVSSKINITGDPGDVFILRWDTDGDPSNGYQGHVKFQSGGGIVPLGGLKPSNFINVAGDINSSGGGSNPAAPYPQGPRYNDGTGALITGGSDWNGGGFFTGYWLTTGSPDNYNLSTGLYYGQSSSLSNGIFVGGWYTINTKFSMTSGTSGVYVAPNVLPSPAISVKKFVSADGGLTYVLADAPPYPIVNAPMNPMYKFVVTNTGDTPLTQVSLTDTTFGLISLGGTLASGASFDVFKSGTFATGQHCNTATATGVYVTSGVTEVKSEASACYVGIAQASVNIKKFVSVDNGQTWNDSNTPPGPLLPSGITPQFKIIITNDGAVTLTDIQVTDDMFGAIGTIPILSPSQSFQWIIS